MIEAVAFCPQAPALVPEVGRGLDAELGAVRAAVVEAIARIRVPADDLVLIGPGSADAQYGPRTRGSFAGFGVDLTVPLGIGDGPARLPAALSVGAYFAGSATRCYAVGPEGTPPDLEGGPVALLVLGDGSARRTEKAPGYLDPRAAGYDTEVRTALASGDPALLGALDADLGAELLAAGAPVWRAVAPLLSGGYDADLLYAGDPFGVAYFVATWTSRSR
jgi:hypothetical protein